MDKDSVVKSIKSTDNWSKHRERWLKRIDKAERKAKIIENGVHSLLDQIEESDGKLTIDEVHSMLIQLLNE